MKIGVGDKVIVIILNSNNPVLPFEIAGQTVLWHPLDGGDLWEFEDTKDHSWVIHASQVMVTLERKETDEERYLREGVSKESVKLWKELTGSVKES